MGDNRPPVYFDDKLKAPDSSPVLVIRASAVGSGCLWELVAAGQGHEPMPVPESLQRAFDEGNEAEPVVIAKLEDEYGVVFLSHQEEGELWLGDEVVVRYHPDGIANLGIEFWKLYRGRQPERLVRVRPPQTCVVEVKAFTHDLWVQAKNHGVASTIKEYEWQLSTMMHDTGLPGLWVVYDKGYPPDKDTGIKPECPNQGELYFEYVDKPPISIEAIQLRASLIKAGVDGEDVTTSDRQCDDPTQWPCRYLHLRPEPEAGNGADDPETYVVPDDRQADVNELVRSYLFHKGQADEAIEARDRYKADLLQLVAEDENLKRIVTERWRIPVVRGTYGYLDTEAMSKADREAFEALKAKYTVRKNKAPYLTKIKRIGE